MQSTTKDVDVDTWPKPTIVSNQLINFNDPILPTRFVKLYWRINQELVGSRDPWLIDKLKAELSGIAVKALRGFQQMMVRGRGYEFIQPDSGLALERELVKAQSPHRAMVAVCLENSWSDDKMEWVERIDARKACQAWLRENGHEILAFVLRDEGMGEHIAAALTSFALYPSALLKPPMASVVGLDCSYPPRAIG